MIHDVFSYTDLFPGTEPPQVEVGTVGWEDEELWYEKGSDENDGHTLVRVQLYRGKPNGVQPKPGIAQGHRLLCHISDTIFRIPKKGTRCYVILPAGFETTPGAGVIVACVSKSPTTQFEADRVVLDFGSDTHVVFKGKSVALSDHASPSRSLSVGTPRTGGTPGVLIHLPDGTGAVWQAGSVGIYATPSTLMQLTPSSFEVQQGSGSFVKLSGGNFHSYGAVNKMQGAGCYIGKAPTPANPAMWGFGPMGLGSPSCFISPV